jgi:hypothetical protein
VPGLRHSQSYGLVRRQKREDVHAVHELVAPAGAHPKTELELTQIQGHSKEHLRVPDTPGFGWKSLDMQKG